MNSHTFAAGCLLLKTQPSSLPTAVISDNYLHRPLEETNVVLLVETLNESWLGFRMPSFAEPVQPSWTRNFCNLYALVIGIDRYDSEDFPPLDSAILDARRFGQYLSGRLSVPGSQIRMLLASDASRNNIIQELKSFQDDQRIQKGDPLVIYYAGHGNEIQAPPSWPSNARSIQSIVPQNYCATRGLEVPCIPDRTIGALLKGIAERKGDNITVIFDCCHAASGTRGKTGERTRSGKKRIVISTEDLDHDIWGIDDEIVYPTPEFRHDGLYSHILIAACGPSERAVECGRYGRFSNALINLLNAKPPEEIQYEKILTLMSPIFGQNPQVDGVNVKRYLFNTRPYTQPLPVYSPLLHVPLWGSHLIPLGIADGVVIGTQFDVMSDNGLNATHVGTFIVWKTMAFYSFLRSDKDYSALSLDTRSKVVAIERKAGVRSHPLHLYLYREVNDRRASALKDRLHLILGDPDFGLHNIQIVDDLERAHVQVMESGGKIAFQLVDHRLGSYNRYVKFALSSPRIVPALRELSEFRWQLDRTNEDETDLMDDIEFSAYFLEEKVIQYETDFVTEMVPIDGRNLLKNDQLDIEIDHERRLGFRINNSGDRALYPVLHYFDFHKLGKSVTLYQPSISGPYLLEAPLQPNQSLTIGHGGGGMPPLCLTLQPNEQLAVGYLKLFLFTRPPNRGFAGILDRNGDPCPDFSEDAWGTDIFRVTLRRHQGDQTTEPRFEWPKGKKTLFAEPIVRTFSTPIQYPIRNK